MKPLFWIILTFLFFSCSPPRDKLHPGAVDLDSLASEEKAPSEEKIPSSTDRTPISSPVESSPPPKDLAPFADPSSLNGIETSAGPNSLNGIETSADPSSLNGIETSAGPSSLNGTEASADPSSLNGTEASADLSSLNDVETPPHPASSNIPSPPTPPPAITLIAQTLPVSEPHAGSPGGVIADTLRVFQCDKLNADGQERFSLHVLNYRIHNLGTHPLCEVMQVTDTKKVLAYANYQREFCDTYTSKFIKEIEQYQCNQIIHLIPASESK